MKLKERKESLSFRPRANKEDENGNIVRMTEEERQKDINEMKAEISKKCNQSNMYFYLVGTIFRTVEMPSFLRIFE